MTECEPDEAQLGRVIEALEQARRRPPRFAAAAEVPVVLSELEEWLADERQWVSGYAGQWRSLIDDLTAARMALGARFGTYLRSGARASIWAELTGVRKALRDRRRGGPDPVLRRRLKRAAEQLRLAIDEADALPTAWEDLLLASTDEVALARAHTLLVLAAEQGLDSDAIASQLAEVLRDSGYRIAILRGEPTNRFESLAERAGASVGERLELCRSLLATPGASGEAVVWLRYLLAPLDPGVMIEISEGVRIYAQGSLREAWVADQRERLPPELRDGNRPHNLATMARIPDPDEDEGDEAYVDPDEGRPPYALIRIDLGRVRFAEALALARETAELLVSLAVLHGADPAIWLLTGDYATFRDGRGAGASFTAPPVFEPNLEQESAMASDRLPFVISKWSEQLAPHLPLTRPDLRRAAQLAYWMRRAQETWEPGRLVLYDRVFEQVAGWAGFTDLGRFVEDCLRPSWPLGRVRNEITNCWAAVHNAGSGPFREISESAWSEIAAAPEIGYVPRDDGGWEVNLKGVLLRLSFILERLSPDSALHERVERLRERTSSAKATLSWLDELDGHFAALRARTRRLRNALVHGGPVGEQAAGSVLPFAEWLATDALHTALDGLLADKGDLIDHFLSRRTAQLGAREGLVAGKSPTEVLFWESD
ncbi:MAG TPA: hypothetical protein VHQ43_03780 [Solirubrobacterales bacterium]|jgi:hypothetical protein|nr:hypothetical protein [Solirubrobacterales bacterium]